MEFRFYYMNESHNHWGCGAGKYSHGLKVVRCRLRYNSLIISNIKIIFSLILYVYFKYYNRLKPKLSHQQNLYSNCSGSVPK